jgi:hypothetical protein
MLSRSKIRLRTRLTRMVLRLFLKMARYWRFLFLGLIAFTLFFIVVLLNQNEAHHLNNKYFNNLIFGHSNLDNMKKLMQMNNLDYEFSHSNSRFCVSSADGDLGDNPLNPININANGEYIKSSKSNNDDVYELKVLFLSISKVKDFDYRKATRQTWSKYVQKLGMKVVFIVGNPLFDESEINSKTVTADTNTTQILSNLNKLKQEKKQFKDIVQINMPDDESYDTIKTLIAIRWSLTYCPITQSLFILKSTAVLNHKHFLNLITDNKIQFQTNTNQIDKNKNKNTPIEVNDSSLIGFCNYTDEKLAQALKEFFNDLYKSTPNQTISKDTITTPKESTNKTDSFLRVHER